MRECVVVWFDDGGWYALDNRGLVMGCGGSVGAAWGEALAAAGLSEADFDVAEDRCDYYRYVRCANTTRAPGRTGPECTGSTR